MEPIVWPAQKVFDSSNTNVNLISVNCQITNVKHQTSKWLTGASSDKEEVKQARTANLFKIGNLNGNRVEKYRN